MTGSKQTIACLCAIAMTMTAPAAHAGTRASDSSVSLAGVASSAPSDFAAAGDAKGGGCRKSEDSSRKSRTCEIVLWVAGTAWLVAFLLDASRQRERDSSYGTGG